MALVPLTDEAEVSRAFATFAERMRRGATELARDIGWHGGGEPHTVYWRREEGSWSVFEPRNRRHWCIFGTRDPADGRPLAITCEINPPQEGVDRRCAGVFLRDDAGRVYVGHTGKIGGGRAGVSKSAFLATYLGDNVETVVWPDGQQWPVIVIGRVDGTRLPRHVAHFAREVARIKDAIVSGDPPPSDPVVGEPVFTPEPRGTREPYRVSDLIESRADHGYVVNALQAELAVRGINAVNDKPRDLSVPPSPGQSPLLFDVKTDMSSSSTYTAIGQLMYHGASHQPPPKRIMVVPEKPDTVTRDILSRLEIAVVCYGWREDAPVFDGLEHALA